MQLVPIPDATGRPAIWVNPDHIVSVAPVFQTTEAGVQLYVEMKIEGSALFKSRMAAYPNREAAAVGFQEFVAGLQAELGPQRGHQ
jgi:hypothetical protein